MSRPADRPHVIYGRRPAPGLGTRRKSYSIVIHGDGPSGKGEPCDVEEIIESLVSSLVAAGHSIDDATLTLGTATLLRVPPPVVSSTVHTAGGAVSITTNTSLDNREDPQCQ